MFKFLSNHGILGINARNLLYIKPYNSRKAVKFADSKLKTKKFLSARGIPVPKLFGTIRSKDELEKFDFSKLPEKFVLKPNLGFGGEGILPIVGKTKNGFIKASGEVILTEEIINHVRDILDGRFSISGITDIAFFEQLIITDDVLGKFSYKGLPDIRVIVHNLVPVMAMVRLPTKESDGKANMHLGAIAAGIDMSKGEITHICKNNKIINEVPGVGPARGLKIPHWDDILLISSKLQLITNLGFLGADFAIDKKSGPVLLEINARSGPRIQIANLAPLRTRLEKIKGIKVPTPEKGVRIAQDLFGHKADEPVAKNISGKKIISEEEAITIISKKGSVQASAKINTSAVESSIDINFAKKIKICDKKSKVKDKVKVKLNLQGTRISTVLKLKNFSNRNYKLSLGTRDLSGFLIDPARKERTLPSDIQSPDNQEGGKLRKLDREIIALDKQIKLLYHIKPINIDDEMDRFLAKKDYNPQFQYRDLEFNPVILKQESERIKSELGNSPIEELFNDKLNEINLKIELLDNIGSSQFTEISKSLFGDIDEESLKEAKNNILQMPEEKDERKNYTSKDAKKIFEDVFKKYRLDSYRVVEKTNMIASCSAGKSNSLFLRKDAHFSKTRIDKLIAHEIETHILTAKNGELQPYRIFNQGFANYLETQEGLAIFNQEMVVGKGYKPSILIASIDIALNGSFRDVYNYLHDEIGYTETRAFRAAARLKRGMANTEEKGSFTKDIVYFYGHKQIVNFVDSGGDLQDLYYGKFNLKYLDKIKEVDGIVEPLYLPKYIA